MEGIYWRYPTPLKLVNILFALWSFLCQINTPEMQHKRLDELQGHSPDFAEGGHYVTNVPI